MKKVFFRHAALVLLIAAIGLLVSTSSRADWFSIPDLSVSFPDLSGLIPAPHADLKPCSIKAVSMDASATVYELHLIADCGGEKNVVMSAGNMDRLKIVYSEALAAFLSDGKVAFSNVAKFSSGELYVAGTQTVFK